MLLLTCFLLFFPIVGFCNCSIFCCMSLYVPSSFAIILLRKKELVALLSLSFWCLVIVVWLFPAVPWVCLQVVIVVFPDRTHILFFKINYLLMHVISIAECSKGSILQYCRPLCLILSGRFAQVNCLDTILCLHYWHLICSKCTFMSNKNK